MILFIESLGFSTEGVWNLVHLPFVFFKLGIFTRLNIGKHLAYKKSFKVKLIMGKFTT